MALSQQSCKIGSSRLVDSVDTSTVRVALVYLWLYNHRLFLYRLVSTLLRRVSAYAFDILVRCQTQSSHELCSCCSYLPLHSRSRPLSLWCRPPLDSPTPQHLTRPTRHKGGHHHHMLPPHSKVRLILILLSWQPHVEPCTWCCHDNLMLSGVHDVVMTTSC